MTLKITVSTRSGRPLRQTFNKVAKSVEKAGEKEILREANEILAASQPFTPLKHGPLRASGRVQGPIRRGKETSVFVIYGGQGVDYAHVRHEVEAMKYTTPGTGIKYLTGPFQKFKPGMAKRVQSGIRRRIGSRGISVS